MYQIMPTEKATLNAASITPLPVRDKVRFMTEAVQDAVSKGAKVINEGGGASAKTLFYPAVVFPVKEGMQLYREEQFGPIVPVLKFTDDEDALRRANETRYGLSGSVWSSNPDRAAALASRLEVGTAWVNHHRATSATVPFGGAKESGIGRIYSEMGLKAYLEPRVISVLKSA